jgi:hypothetical protein
MFPVWCLHHSIVPPLDGAYEWNSPKEQYTWKPAKSRNQKLFRSIIRLGTHSISPEQQSNWQLLSHFPLDRIR